MSTQNKVGRILTDASTASATMQVLEAYEAQITEGKLMRIIAADQPVLSYSNKIEPHNDFYTKGEEWAESIRKDYPIPKDIARRYVTCNLDIVGIMPNLEQLDKPPLPGNEVYEIEVTLPHTQPTPNKPCGHCTELNSLFGKDFGSRGYFWLGTLLGYSNIPLPLNSENALMHMGIFGNTGSGKSFTTGAIIEKFCNIPSGDTQNQNPTVAYPMIITDPNSDYLEYATQRTDFLTHYPASGGATSYVFPSSNWVQNHQNTAAFSIDFGNLTDGFSAQDMSEIILQFHHGAAGTDSADLQISGLTSLINYVYENSTANITNSNELFNSRPIREAVWLNEAGQANPSILAQAATGTGLPGLQIHGGTEKAIRRALTGFLTAMNSAGILGANNTTILNREWIDHIVNNRQIAIFDFSFNGAPGITLQLKQLLVGYLAKLVYTTFTTNRARRRYLLFLIEEAHNFIPNESVYPVGGNLAKRTLQLIATQGRKFGIGLGLISQSPQYLDPVVGAMINTFFIHRVSYNDLAFVSKVAPGLNKDHLSKITTQSKGRVLVTGQMNDVLSIPLPIRILPADRRIEHTAGTTSFVADTLESMRNPPANNPRNPP